jgi:aminodeoxyfutalosine deaminase
MPDPIPAFIDTLPKAELHVHLVGSASLPTVLDLARKHTGHDIPDTEEGLRAFYTFRDFDDFIRTYLAVNAVVRDADDVRTLVLGLARDLAAQNGRYVELTVSPYTHVQLNGTPAPAITEALDDAARTARERHGLRVAYIFDFAGEFGADAAPATLEHALSHPPRDLVGFGVGGSEKARASCWDAIRDAFTAARNAGLHSVPHAGETTGPETIWAALDELGAERIGHGTTALRDPALVERLRAEQIPLEVCPSSNVATGQVPDLAGHPLPRMLDAGLNVTLNSDDPPMFGTSLTEEYRRAAATYGFGVTELADLAAATVRASFIGDAAKSELLSDIDAAAAAAGKIPAE